MVNNRNSNTAAAQASRSQRPNRNDPQHPTHRNPFFEFCAISLPQVKA